MKLLNAKPSEYVDIIDFFDVSPDGNAINDKNVFLDKLNIMRKLLGRPLVYRDQESDSSDDSSEQSTYEIDDIMFFKKDDSMEFYNSNFDNYKVSLYQSV